MARTNRKRYPLHNYHVRRGVLRAAVVILLIAVQIAWIVALIMRLERRMPWVGTIVTYAAVAMVLFIYSRSVNSAYKLMWIILIAAFPILGTCLYLLAGRSRANSKML